jgi:NADH-quinone oxidoreductase subunit F
MVDILRRLEGGTGWMQDGTLLTSVANNIAGKSFCLLGDASAAPVVSSAKLFREEYEAHVRAQGCPLRSAWIRAGLNMMPDRVLMRT